MKNKKSVFWTNLLKVLFYCLLLVAAISLFGLFYVNGQTDIENALRDYWKN